MNKDQFEGGARKLGGEVEDAFGKAMGSDKLRGEGVIDQVAGAAQGAYGDVRDAVETAVSRAAPVIRDGAERAATITRENSVFTALTVGALAYGLAWFIHGSGSRNHSR